MLVYLYNIANLNYVWGEIEGDPSALYFWRHVVLFDPAQNILFVTPGATTAPT